jgi:nucleoside-diphosphate-sugar epimerase
VKVLLTGATGFIGARVAHALVEAGAEVLAVVLPGDTHRLSALPGVSFVEGDLLRPGGMDQAVRAGADTCVHAAWYAEPGKYLSAPVNVDLAQASTHFAAALAKAGCRRFVGVGTCFEYDTDVGYLAETTPLAPRHLYSAAKVATFTMIRQIVAGTPMSFAWARVFYLYGPGEHPKRLVPAVMDALLRGDEARVTPGGQIRDFLHVDDVASALRAVASSDVQGPVNIGSGEPVTVAAIVEKIGAILGRTDLIRLGAQEYSPGDPMFVCANNALLKSLGWTRRYSLDEGLNRTALARRDAFGGER